MEQHLVLRMKALQDLAAFLKKYCPPLSRSAKWKLLSDAERLAAARALWKTHDRRVADKEQGHVALLEEAIDTALERYKEDGNAKSENVDDVRFFFTKKLDSLEKLFPFCFGLIKERHKNGALHTPDFLRLAPEMNELIVTVLGTAYQYRQRHILEYGLGDENIEEGLLAVGFEDLDRFWTSSDDVIKTVSWSIKLTHDLVSTVLGKQSEGSHAEEAEAIGGTMEEVIRLSCKSHVEGYRWLMGQSDEENKQKGIEMKTAFESQLRRNHISYLYNMGQVQRALVVAEDLEDIPALVDLALQELDFQKGAQRRLATSKTQKNRPSAVDLEVVEEQVRHFFRKFGQRFAEPFYAGQVASHRLADLIDKDLGTKESRTTFLRSDPTYGKISWINEVLNEDDLFQASNNLMDVAQSRESNAWSQRIELSIAKLALMTVPGASAATSELEGDGSVPVVAQLSQSNKHELEILRVQQQLSAVIRPAIVDALDEEAKLNNVMASFGHGFADTHPSLTQVLRLGFSDLISQRVMGADSLIDVLTLMTIPTRTGEASDPEIGQDQFYLALKVLESASSSPKLTHSTTQMLRQLIWKRCIVSQDWNEFGRTADLSDSDFQEGLKETAVFHTIKHGIKEGKLPLSWNLIMRHLTDLRKGFFTPPLDATIPLASDVVGAGSNADDYIHRFPSEDLRGPIAADNSRDDDTLKEYIESAHLDDIWSTIKELAMTVADEESQEEAEKRHRYEEFVTLKDNEEQPEYAEEQGEEEYDEDYIKEEEVDENDVRQGIESLEGVEEVDEDGDVEMDG
jgi:nuclear pore complex protein Nup133